MFGEWGGMILQFTVTIVVILGLIGGAYWLVRRYSSGGLGRIARGRVPRLAIIDAMPVDGRRKLVLVRRDNIEHLILIGGPSDVVVEQAIQRPRRPAAKPQPGAAQGTPAQGEAPSDPATGERNQPIPFPQARIGQPSVIPLPSYRPEPTAPAQPAGYQAPPASYQPTPQPIERPFSPIRRATQQQPQPAEPEPQPAPAPTATVVQFEPMTESTSLFADLPPVDTSRDDPAAFIRRAGEANGQQAGAYGGRTASPAGQVDDTAAKVNDLEREMARLLGEITAKRPS